MTPAEALEATTSRLITKVDVLDTAREDGALRFAFADGSRLDVWDDGRSCCEARYLHTDDDLESFAGSTLLDIELRDGPTASNEEWCDEHEVGFLVVTTDRGVFTVCTHNRHNGYYGGFSVVAEVSR